MPKQGIEAGQDRYGPGEIRSGEPVAVDVVTGTETAPVSARMIEVGLRFGVPMIAPAREIVRGLELPVRPGTVTLVTGPSGAGKSLLLAAIGRRFPLSQSVQNIQFPADVAVVDAVAPTRPIAEALGVLTACGLGEPMLWVRRFSSLSDGEQFRARLARAVSLHRRERVDASGAWPAPLLCDEFGAVLHQRLAQAIAFNLRKLVTRERLALVIATSRDDLEADLQPDTVVRLGGEAPGGGHPRPPLPPKTGGQECPLPDLNPRKATISFARRLRIQRGTMADYARFSSMHYRHSARVGVVDKVFVCRDGLDGPALGVVVYGRPTLELKLRNQVTGHRFCKEPGLLNRELRVLKRLVIHPDVRGCGIGHWLVRRTLLLVGTRYVECLAAMGAVNPVFAKAGMRLIGVCEPPTNRDRTVEQLRAAGADPLSADFVSHVSRRPAVRRLVARSILRWYHATSANGEQRLTRQTPRELAQTFRQIVGSAPVYYLWESEEGGRSGQASMGETQ